MLMRQRPLRVPLFCSVLIVFVKVTALSAAARPSKMLMRQRPLRVPLFRSVLIVFVKVTALSAAAQRMCEINNVLFLLRFSERYDAMFHSISLRAFYFRSLHTH
jgi:hypothetical protein